MRDFGLNNHNGIERGVIKSIQTGTMDLNNLTSQTATITAVDINNSMLIFNGVVATTDGANNDDRAFCYNITLTNATTVTGAINLASALSRIISFTVLEFYPGIIKSIQRGTITTGAGSNIQTSTITTVNVNKSICSFLGVTTSYSNNTGSMFANRHHCSMVLTNSTTVTLTTGGNDSQRTGSYEIIEYY
jgi:hypothetical protein